MNSKNLTRLGLIGAGLALILTGCTTADPSAARTMNGTWCSLGTSISWYNDHVDTNRFTRGYQSRVMDVLAFDGFVNPAINGGTVVGQAAAAVPKADYYTIEHGINDWGHSTPVGTIDDYKSRPEGKSFCSAYRRLIDKIRAANPSAKIVLCTPRRGFGFGKYLPATSDEPKNGIYLREYAEAVRAIAAQEGFPVADFFERCGTDYELPALSIDRALHPNDVGYQRMANELIRAFGQVRQGVLK